MTRNFGARFARAELTIVFRTPLLGTVLHATARASIGAFGADDPGRAVDSVAAGNVAAALQAVPAAQRHAFHAFLIGSYDTAFHGVLWILMGHLHRAHARDPAAASPAQTGRLSRTSLTKRASWKPTCHVYARTRVLQRLGLSPV